jgi:hypothetical protein
VSALVNATLCPACGGELLRTEQGTLCAPCALLAAMSTAADASDRVGGYELLQLLDQGGTGLVYVARDVEHEALVALKLAKPEILQSAASIAAFRAGLSIQRDLSHHPNVVSTYGLGTHDDGRPFLAMHLLDGGTLDEPTNWARFRSAAHALELMIKVSKAVQFAHERGVLHCDLKPANILIDEAGEPFVSDFGLARVMSKASIVRRVTFEGITPGWASPEQVLQQELTTASDVFSLGVILYWLLTGVMPFGDDDAFVRRVAHEEHVPLRRHYSGELWWELDCICGRALRKSPGERYRSATELVEDLERAASLDFISGERRRPVRRGLKWVRRQPIAALAVIEFGMLAVYLLLTPISVLREVKDALREQIVFSASAQAGAVTNELRAGVARVDDMARDPEIQALVHHHDLYSPPQRLAERASGFDGISVFTTEGELTARWPKPRVRVDILNYAFRDYFQGQRRLGLAGQHGVYIGRAFRSVGDQQVMLGFSAPLFDAGGRYVGAIVAHTAARATFGSVQMNCTGNGSCMTALLGPRDRDEPDQRLSDQINVLAAPGLIEGQELAVERQLSKLINARFPMALDAKDQFKRPVASRITLAEYETPVARERSMAVLAPVAQTGLVVVVATPNNALDAITQRIDDRIQKFVWVPLLIGLVLFVMIVGGPRLAVSRRRLQR